MGVREKHGETTTFSLTPSNLLLLLPPLNPKIQNHEQKNKQYAHADTDTDTDTVTQQ